MNADDRRDLPWLIGMLLLSGSWELLPFLTFSAYDWRFTGAIYPLCNSFRSLLDYLSSLA